MKKIITALLSLSILVLCIFAMTSCAEKLSEPTGFVLDEETLSLSWNKVVGAKSYTVKISGQEREKTTKSTSFSLEELDAGTYEIRVKANGDDQNYKDSSWSVYKFERDAESGIKYKLINNDTEYEVAGAGSAEGDIVIDDYYRGKPVTSIGAKAFYNNSKITSVTIGKNVRTIGDKVFTKSANLKSVIIPESVTSIGNYVFQSCKALESIEIPNGVTTISPFTFSWCTSLKSAKIGNAVTTIGEYAFSNCEALESFVIPDTVTFIDQYAFSDCHVLADLKLGAGIEEIAIYAFYNCYMVNSIEFGDKIHTIGGASFGNNKTITTLTIPDSVKSIEYGAFKGCTALEEVHIGTGVTSLGSDVFSETTIYNNAETILVIDNWVAAVKDKNIEKLEIPEEVYGIADFAYSACGALESIKIKGIKYVGAAAFYNCPKLWEVIFDDSLITLGDNAFRACTYLVDIKLKEGLVSIGNFAFMGCSRLNKVDLPDSLTSVGSYTFNDTLAYLMQASNIVVCMDDWVVGAVPAPMALGGIHQTVKIEEGIKGIANYSFYGVFALYVGMPESLEYIGRGAFYGDAYNRSMILPENLKYIGDYAFYNCVQGWFSEDGTTVIPEGTEYIGRSAFYNCGSMIGLTVPGTVKTIGMFAFCGCVNLGESNLVYDTAPDEPLVGEVTLGEGIEYIGDHAFRNAQCLATITIPDSVTYLGHSAFFKCLKLREVNLGSGLKEINEYTFYKCPQIESISFSDNMETVKKYAFRGCESLKELDLGGVKHIEKYAFYQCTALTDIVIPETVVSIASNAFRGCSEVTSVTIDSAVSTIGDHAFYGLNKATIYCESASRPEGWNLHFNSSFRPIIWGCKISDENYVVSFTKTEETAKNLTALNGVSAPTREGYVFKGWSTAPVNDNYTEGEWNIIPGSAFYEAKDLINAPNDTVLYAVWVVQTTEN